MFFKLSKFNRGTLTFILDFIEFSLWNMTDLFCNALNDLFDIWFTVFLFLWEIIGGSSQESLGVEIEDSLESLSLSLDWDFSEISFLSGLRSWLWVTSVLKLSITNLFAGTFGFLRLALLKSEDSLC